MKTAKGAVLTAAGRPFEVREFPLSSPPEGMAKIRLTASGICGTDVHIHDGRLPVQTPVIIGHEFIGRVEEISETDSEKHNIRKDDNVIVYIACPCGECLLCRSGDDANCVNMGVTNGSNPNTAPHLYGGFAEYNYSPVANLIRIPPELDPEMTCVFACAGPTVLHAFSLAERANSGIEKADVTVVQGLGPVGFFAVMKLASMGVKHIIALTGRENAYREELALKFGAARVMSLEKHGMDKIIEYIKALSSGLGADVVIEASGNPSAVPQGMDMLRNRGVYLVPGQYSNSGPVEIAPEMITFKALHIIGSSQYSLSDVQNYIDFLLKNPHTHSTILSLASRYKVEDINRAFDDVRAGKNIKTLLTP